MTSTDYIIDALLILSIFKSVREKEFSLRTLLLPIGLLTFAISHYLTAVPTAGNDVGLYVVLGGIGGALGAICGLTTMMRTDATGTVVSRAGVVTVVAWCVGMVSRAGFAFWSSHGGAHAIAHFSAAHAITSASAWTAALLLMAVAQVVTKLGIQLVRARMLDGRGGAVAVA